MGVPHILLGPSPNCDAAHYVCFATILARPFFENGSRAGPAQPNPVASRRFQPPADFSLGGWGGESGPLMFEGGWSPRVPRCQKTFCGAAGYPGPREFGAQPAPTA